MAVCATHYLQNSAVRTQCVFAVWQKQLKEHQQDLWGGFAFFNSFCVGPNRLVDLFWVAHRCVEGWLGKERFK